MTSSDSNSNDLFDRCREYYSKYAEHIGPAERFDGVSEQFPEIADVYHKQLKAQWTTDHITGFDADLEDYKNASETERAMLDNALSFFNFGDVEINDNIRENLMGVTDLLSDHYVSAWYNLQAQMEDVHHQTYTLFIERLVPDPSRRKMLEHAILTDSNYQCKVGWMLHKFNDPELSLAHHVVAGAIIEGIFFSGAFAVIFWFNFADKDRSRFKAITQANEWIRRDEWLHCQQAANIYHAIKGDIAEDIKVLVDEAVSIEIELFAKTLPKSLPSMNIKIMTQHIQYMADRVLELFHIDPLYDVEPAASWLVTANQFQKVNYFERENTQYKKSNMSLLDDDTVRLSSADLDSFDDF